jgi:PleD family two-component response regulator
VNILVDSSLIEVQQRLDNIREIVKKIEIRRGKECFGGVTLSIGIVDAHESGWTTSRLLRAAKKAGRDRIVVYPAVDWTNEAETTNNFRSDNKP